MSKGCRFKPQKKGTSSSASLDSQKQKSAKSTRHLWVSWSRCGIGCPKAFFPKEIQGSSHGVEPKCKSFPWCGTELKVCTTQLPITPKIKSKDPTTGCKALRNLTHPISLTSFHPCPHTHVTMATLAFSLFFKQTKPVPTSGPYTCYSCCQGTTFLLVLPMAFSWLHSTCVLFKSLFWPLI